MTSDPADDPHALDDVDLAAWPTARRHRVRCLVDVGDREDVQLAARICHARGWPTKPARDRCRLVVDVIVQRRRGAAPDAARLQLWESLAGIMPAQVIDAVVLDTRPVPAQQQYAHLAPPTNSNSRLKAAWRAVATTGILDVGRTVSTPLDFRDDHYRPRLLEQDEADRETELHVEASRLPPAEYRRGTSLSKPIPRDPSESALRSATWMGVAALVVVMSLAGGLLAALGGWCYAIGICLGLMALVVLFAWNREQFHARGWPAILGSGSIAGVLFLLGYGALRLGLADAPPSMWPALILVFVAGGGLYRLFAAGSWRSVAALIAGLISFSTLLPYVPRYAWGLYATEGFGIPEDAVQASTLGSVWVMLSAAAFVAVTVLTAISIEGWVAAGGNQRLALWSIRVGAGTVAALILLAGMAMAETTINETAAAAHTAFADAKRPAAFLGVQPARVVPCPLGPVAVNGGSITPGHVYGTLPTTDDRVWLFEPGAGPDAVISVPADKVTTIPVPDGQVTVTCPAGIATP